MDINVIGHIIAEVVHRRREDGRHPDRVHVEAADVVQPADDARQVADAVGVAILIRAGVNLIDDAGLPPQQSPGYSLPCCYSFITHDASRVMKDCTIEHSIGKGPRRPSSIASFHRRPGPRLRHALTKARMRASSKLSNFTGLYSIHPVGQHHQLPLGMGRLIGLESHAEIVRTAHTLVHGKLKGEVCLLAGLQCRRTDDGRRRSTPLHDGDHRISQNLQRLVAGVGQPESRLDRDVQRHVTEVELLLIYRQPGADIAHRSRRHRRPAASRGATSNSPPTRIISSAPAPTISGHGVFPAAQNSRPLPVWNYSSYNPPAMLLLKLKSAQIGHHVPQLRIGV